MAQEESFLQQVKKIHDQTPIDVILDYLWGHSAELILRAVKGKGPFTHRTRFVSIGSIAGDLIQLSAENIRSTDIQLTGSGMGSWDQDQVDQLFKVILHEMFRLAAEGKLKIDTYIVSLGEIENIWSRTIPGGARVVLKI